MNILIRPAAEADYAGICKINREALGYDFDVRDTERRLKKILSMPTELVAVAEAGGTVVGYIHGSCYECTYSEPLKNILALAVMPNFQGKGAGRMLTSRLEEWAKNDGCIGVRLVSSSTRTGAHAFYRACGYDLRKEQKNFIKLF